MTTRCSSAARSMTASISASLREAPVGLPGLMTTMQRTSVPASFAELIWSRMSGTLVPQELGSSR